MREAKLLPQRLQSKVDPILWTKKGLVSVSRYSPAWPAWGEKRARPTQLAHFATISVTCLCQHLLLSRSLGDTYGHVLTTLPRSIRVVHLGRGAVPQPAMGPLLTVETEVV